MKVPFLDLKAQHQAIQPELQLLFRDVVQTCTFVLGPHVETFEREFAAFQGATHCVALNSGTAALHLSLLAAGIGPGDEVLTVPNTFIATAEAITATGARPVFVDVDPISYTMDSSKVEECITERTRALLPVHLYGQSCDLDPLLEIARTHNLTLIEDACQAHGARYKGRPVGTFGMAGCFSFYPGKNLGACGEGGAVVTNDADVARRVRMLRDHGSARKYFHDFPGYNYRLEALQGGVLSIKLPHLEQWNERRREIAEQYTAALAVAEVRTPVVMPFATHVFHLYVILSDARDELREQLAARGIETGIHYPVPLHLQEAYRCLGYAEGDFPVSERLSQMALSLPMFPQMTAEQIGAVITAVKECTQCVRSEALKAAS